MPSDLRKPMNEDLSFPGTLPSKEDHGNFPSMFWGDSSIRLSLSRRSHSPALQPRPALETPTFSCQHPERSKRLAEENLSFLSRTCQAESDFRTGNIRIGLTDLTPYSLPFHCFLGLWTCSWPLRNCQYGQKLKMTLH